MSYRNDQQLRYIVNTFFDDPDPIERVKREGMYRAFKARLILELSVQGWCNEGAVGGHLTDD